VSPTGTSRGDVDAVLFDLHFTLVHQRPAADWLADAWRHAGRDGEAGADLPAAGRAELALGLDELWDRAAVLDPGKERDLDPVRHRQVFDGVVAPLPGMDGALLDALYATLHDVWVPYPDTLPVLRALADHGVRTAVLSNVGIDVRPVLARIGVAELVTAVVLSCDHGVVKPDPAMFELALAAVGAPATRTVMVGDNWRDDGAAAALGIRTLILPSALGRENGLRGVLGLAYGG
jgi:HAD superfamily hydrolase (TIGR01493 family)